ncbi:hypothetical protein [Nonomuraea sp. GTA35]
MHSTECGAVNGAVGGAVNGAVGGAEGVENPAEVAMPGRAASSMT